MSDQQILTVGQVAKEMQVTAQTIRNWIDSGALPAAKIGRSFRIKRADVDELLTRAQADSASLATRRDVWEPQALTLPRRPSEAERAPSIWEGTSPAAVVLPSKRPQPPKHKRASAG
ncbi:MAG TPA: helix-turn-helix domain-containing protein [Solirubrobacteraceae bacterium]|jgi:excisionase family DNA binding protein